MKNLFTLARPIWGMVSGSSHGLAATLVLVLVARLPLFAQFLPAANGDFPIYPSGGTAYTVQNVRHTGYDMLSDVTVGLCPMQVYVWDGDDGGFGWNAYGHKGTIRFDDPSLEADGLIDPDVIVGRGEGDQIFAHVVGIVPRTVSAGFGPHTVYTLYYCVFHYNGCGFDLVEESCFNPIGEFNSENIPPRVDVDDNGVPIFTPSNATADGTFLIRNVSSPNIDANSSGDIAITWTETEWIKTSITLGDPYSASPSNPIHIIQKKGNVLYAEAHIGDPCPDDCRSHFVNDNGEGDEDGIEWFGAPIAIENDENEFPNLFFSHSDVCISERPGSDPAVVSFAYNENRTGFFGAGSGVNLATVQMYFGICYDFETPTDGTTPITQHRFNSYTGMNLGVPRIAAPNNTSELYDFRVVSGEPIGGCGASGFFSDSRITMVGRKDFNGSPDYLDAAVTLNEFLGSDLFYRDYIHREPVISYVNSDFQPMIDNIGTPLGIYVSWSCYQPDRHWDVIAKAYDDMGIASSTTYSIVPGNTSGFDVIPSIQGRREGGNKLMGYFWVNSVEDEMEVHTRLTLGTSSVAGFNIPGQSELDGTECEEECPPFILRVGNPGKNGLAPNPVKAGGSLNIASEDAIQSIRIVSASGQEIEGIQADLSSASKATITVPSTLSRGLYTVKATTDKGVVNYKIVVE